MLDSCLVSGSTDRWNISPRASHASDSVDLARDMSDPASANLPGMSVAGISVRCRPS